MTRGARVGDPEVREIISSDPDISMVPFIQAASAMVNQVDSCDSDNALSSTDKIQIEKWLAAHFYAVRDQQYQSKKTADASATFQGETGMGLNSTFWGQTALRLDHTGCLAQVEQQASKGRKKASFHWSGKPPSEQIDYVDRD